MKFLSWGLKYWSGMKTPRFSANKSLYFGNDEIQADYSEIVCSLSSHVVTDDLGGL